MASGTDVGALSPAVVPPPGAASSARIETNKAAVNPPRKPAIAYLTTAYPSVSHTFIRREIQALELLGYSIERVAIRRGTAVVDPLDQQEERKTLHVLEQPKRWIGFNILRGMLIAKLKVLTAAATILRLSSASERGLFRHLAYLAEALILLAELRARRIQHVHVHFGTNAAAVALLVNVMGGPSYSMTVHGPDEFDAPIGLSVSMKMQRALFTIAISSYCAAQLRRWVPYDEWHKIHVVRCTVADEWFAAGKPLSDAADALVSIGRLSEQKGQLLLVDALAAAVAQGFKGRLVLVGDGPLRPQIERRIQSLGLSDRVHITGWATNGQVREWLLKARGLVLPSFAEGLPVVLMEAMALQRPVIASQIMGIPELVRHAVHGWLVISGSHESLVQALLEFDATPLDRLREMGAACASAVAQNHCTELESRKLDDIFLRYLPNQSPLEAAESMR